MDERSRRELVSMPPSAATLARARWLAELGPAARALVRELPGILPALVVVALLICVLVPLPTLVVDLALSLSLAGSLLALVATLRVHKTAELLGFPTLVLLLTLVRLALNVSTTRLILSEADAGRVIDAFAGLVVRGDLLIGAVMFGVITAIQMLVITRGSERVAEVAARFALDGMPGQQAAIEADLRSGAIGLREAQARRQALLERADLFGRMDGVMRWVKGDALVGLAIVAVNLIGGIAIGMSRAGLGLGESLEVYGRLTIGDGLLAQVPALLVSLAAGVLVARIDRSEPAPASAVAWIEPSWLFVPALLLGLLAAVPGMPTVAFAGTSLGLLGAALALTLAREPARARARSLAHAHVQVRVHVDERKRGELTRALEGLRRRCSDALGFELPSVRIEPATERLRIDELELRRGERVLARERMVDPQARARASIDAIVLASFHGLMTAAPSLIELDTIERAVERARRERPELVQQALRTIDLVDLLALLRGFVRERIPLPPFEALLRELAERRVFSQASERPHWLEHARLALADHWLRDLCDGVARLGAPVWLRATADLEDELLDAAELDEQGSVVGWSDAKQLRLIARVRELAGSSPTLVTCSSRARPLLARVLARMRPHVPVLAIAELTAASVELPTHVLHLDVVD